MRPPREVELKLELPASSLPKVTRSVLRPMAARMPATPARLVSVYFDTKKLKLRKKGMSLRVRRDGPRHVQTIEQDGSEARGASLGKEWEREIGGSEPDLGAARATPLEPLLGKKLRRGLMPVFATRVRRTVYPVHRENAEIDLILDKGSIEAGRRSSALCEVQFELRRGDAAELFKLARTFADEFPVELAVTSAAERGYRLAAGDKPAAVKTAPVAVSPELDVQRAFQAIAAACLRQLAANIAIVRAGDPEGVHQARVALRRLRTAISLFSPMLDDAQTEAVKGELKWITGELGPARELEVFISRVAKPVAGGNSRGPGVRLLTRDLRQKRKDAFEQACRAIDSARFRRLVVDTVAWIEVGDWTHNAQDAARSLRERTIAAAAADELKRHWKKIIKKGEHLGDLAPERRHKLRIRAKKLRYAAEFFAAAFPGRKPTRLRKRFLKGLKGLQDALGDMNDIVVHGELAEQFVEAGDRRGRRARAPANKAFAAGRLSGHEQARMASVLKEAEEAYAAFARAEPFWT
jgi:triphosphatase